MRSMYFASLSSKLIIATALIGALCACEPSNEVSDHADVETASDETDIRVDVAAASAKLFNHGDSALAAAQTSADQLQQAIQEFLRSPNQNTLSAAQSQWRQALLDFRKFTGPAQISIADANTFKQMNRLDYQIATFPIQPGFLDKFGPHLYSGIVHDIGMEISEESLSGQHGLTDLSEAVLGLYPIEFMLFNRGKPRDIEDYKKIAELDSSLRERGFENLAEVPNNRRRRLLQTQAELLNKNIVALAALWSGPTAEVRTTWDGLADSKKIALGKEALGGSLTRIMLEVSELNSDAQDDDDFEATISPSVKSADFAFHQNFIATALASLKPLSNFYADSERTALQETFTALEALSQTGKLGQEQTAKDHWREVFKLIKRASDISAGGDLLDKTDAATAPARAPTAAAQSEAEGQ